MEPADTVLVDVDSIWGRLEMHGSRGEKTEEDFKHASIILDVTEFAELMGDVEYDDTGHETPHCERRFRLTREQMRSVFRIMDRFDRDNNQGQISRC